MSEEQQITTQTEPQSEPQAEPQADAQADAQTEAKVEPGGIPHIAIITIRWIINQQLPDGQFHPRAVDSDSFSIKIFGNNEQECVEQLKTKIEKMKEAAEWNT